MRLVVGVLCMAAFLSVIWPNRTVVAGEPIKVITVQVEAGDSLWKLAATYDCNNKMDIRKYIYLIKEYNNLDSFTIQPGQIIELPIYS